MMIIKSIFLSILFISITTTFSSANVEKIDVDAVDLFLILKSIENINSKIEKSKSTDETQEQKNVKVESVIDSKLKTLDRASRAIFFGYVEDSQKIADDLREKSSLEVRIDINRNFGYEYAVLRDEAKVELINLNKRANEFFISLNSEVKNNFEKETIGELLDGEIEEIKSMSLSKYQSILENNTGGELFLELKESVESLESRKRSYLELLHYMNSTYEGYIGTEAKIINKLNIKYFRDEINRYVGYKVGRFGAGELAISVVIILFFLSLRKALSRLIVYLGNRVVYKIENKQNKEYLDSLIKTPLAYLLFVISIEFSFDAIYYPEVVSNEASRIFYTLEIMGVTWAIFGLIRGYGKILVSKIATKNELLRKEVVNLFIKVLYFFIIVFAFLLILHRFDINVSAIVASLGIGGLAVALAAKDTLANFFASIMILLDNSISQGDWIVCGGDEGTVVEIGLRTTTIRTFDNALIFIPNSKLSAESIRNWNRRELGRRIKMHIGVTYSSKKESVEKCVEEIREMLLSHPDIATPLNVNDNSTNDVMLSYNDLKGYKNTLLVYLDQFSSSSIDILIYCFSKSVSWQEWLEIKQDVMLKVMDIVEKNKLEFAFPSQSLYIESTPESKQKKEKDV